MFYFDMSENRHQKAAAVVAAAVFTHHSAQPISPAATLCIYEQSASVAVAPSPAHELATRPSGAAQLSAALQQRTCRGLVC